MDLISFFLQILKVKVLLKVLSWDLLLTVSLTSISSYLLKSLTERSLRRNKKNIKNILKQFKMTKYAHREILPAERPGIIPSWQIVTFLCNLPNRPVSANCDSANCRRQIMCQQIIIRQIALWQIATHPCNQPI